MKGTFVLRLSVIVVLLLQGGLSAAQETYWYKHMWPVLNQPWYFVQPRAITRDLTGNLYVVDSIKCTIDKLSTDGFFITRWGSFGSGDGEFNQPKGVCVDAEDNLYIVDADNHRIQKFNSNGTFVDKWGKNSGDGTCGSGSGEFCA